MPAAVRKVPWRRRHRYLRYFLEALLGLIAGIVVLAGFAAWRLSEGPLRLSFLSPRLEAALSQATGLRVKIGQTYLVWNGPQQNLDLRVEALALSDAAGQEIALLDEANIAIVTGALLEGRLEADHLEILSPEFLLERRVDGELVAQAEGEEDADAAGLLDRLLDSKGEAGGTTGLASLAITIVDAKVSFIDHVLGLAWRAPHVDATFKWENGNLVGELSAELALGSARPKMAGTFQVSKETGDIDLKLELQALKVDALAGFAPDAQWLSGLAFALSGPLDARLNGAGELKALNFNLQAGSGAIWLDGVMTQSLAIGAGRLTGGYDEASDAWKITQGRFLLAGGDDAPIADFTLTRRQTGETARIDGTLAIDRLATNDLAKYWPEGAAENARIWTLGNVAEGEVVGLNARFAVEFSKAAEKFLALEGGFGFNDLSIRYLAPMSPAGDVVGTARFDLDGLDFKIDQAAIGLVALGPISVTISGLTGNDHRLALYAEGDGALGDLLVLLDQEPLGLLEGSGIDPSAAGGKANFTLSLGLPLIQNLAYADVTLNVSGDVTDLVLPDLLDGKSLSAPSVSVTVDAAGLTAKGRATLANLAANVTWTEKFANHKTRVEARDLKLDSQSLADQGLDLQPYLSGDLVGDAEIEDRSGGKLGLTLNFDLTGAALSLPWLQWSKEAGEAASISAEVTLADAAPALLEGFSFEGPGLITSGRAGFSEGSKLSLLELDRLQLGQSDLSGVRVAIDEGVTRISIGSGSLDSRPYLEGDQDKEREGSFSLDAPSLSQLLVPGGALEAVTLSLAMDPQGIQNLQLVGRLPPALWAVAGASDVGEAPSNVDRRITLTIEGRTDGSKALSAESNDMGAVLRAFDILESVRGGEVRLQGIAANKDAPYVGSLEARDYVVVDMPAFARILTAASLTGIADLTQQDGIAFERLTGDLTFDDKLIETSLLRAYGGALGITAKGRVDFVSDTIDMQGTLVPAYAANQVLGAIPLLGWILTGGEGGGLLAVTYYLSGSLAEPRVASNPLSLLTPGFLRALFDLPGGDGSTPPPMLFPDGEGGNN